MSLIGARMRISRISVPQFGHAPPGHFLAGRDFPHTRHTESTGVEHFPQNSAPTGSSARHSGLRQIMINWFPFLRRQFLFPLL